MRCRHRIRVFGPGLVGAALGIAGCTAPFAEYQADVQVHLDHGRYDLVEKALDDPDNALRDCKRDELLWMLDRGTVALVLDDAPTTVEVLNEAEELMDVRRKRGALEQLAAITLSDQLTTYLGEPYEDIYVNVLKMLAHLEAGQLRGGATVEARRLATKVDVLRDEYLRLERRLASPGSSGSAVTTPVSLEVASVPGGEFIESPLGTFLTAVTFMRAGDRSNQVIAARRLKQAIDAQRRLIGPVQARDFLHLERLEPQDVNFLAVALSGRGPYKVPQSVGPLIVHGAPVYFELPILRRRPSDVVGVRLRVQGARTRTAHLHLIENLGSVAYENHRRQLPVTYLRTLARAAGKSYAVHEAGRVLHAGDQHGLADLTTTAGLMFVMATERADLRCWSTLPGQAHVELLRLEPGRHSARLEYLDARGRVVHRSPPRSVEITDDRLTTLVEAYWG